MNISSAAVVTSILRLIILQTYMSDYVILTFFFLHLQLFYVLLN